MKRTIKNEVDWEQQATMKNGHCVVVDGVLYRYFPSSKVMEGDNYFIQFFNGRMVFTKKVQRVGKIPSHMAEKFKENARIYKRTEVCNGQQIKRTK